ncbi:MAG: TaqI-like C-terminal specificity domain-containing protein, partial [Nitrosospira sp.]
RGFNLLKQNGQFAYITSNKYLRAKYGTGLRKSLSEKVKLDTIIDFGDLPVFDAAAYPCIVLAQKQTPSANIVNVLAVTNIDILDRLPSAMRTLPTKMAQEKLSADVWNISDSYIQDILDRLNKSSTPLGKLVNGMFFMGVKTGLNSAFVIDLETRNRLVGQDAKSAEIIKPFLIGRDVKRWQFVDKRRYVIFTHHGIQIDQYPAAKAYLEPFRDRLQARATSANHEWYEIQQPQMGIYPDFQKPKIIYPEFGIKPEFAYDTQGYFINNKLFTIPTDDFYLLGVLNSNVVHLYLSENGSKIRGGYIEFRWMTLVKIPIPTPSADLRERIAAAALACLDAAKDHPDRLPALEAELNALVYQAYGLDKDDIRVMEGSISKQNAGLIETDELIGDDDAT